jgi:hypothetical protein
MHLIRNFIASSGDHALSDRLLLVTTRRNNHGNHYDDSPARRREYGIIPLARIGTGAKALGVCRNVPSVAGVILSKRYRLRSHQKKIVTRTARSLQLIDHNAALGKTYRDLLAGDAPFLRTLAPHRTEVRSTAGEPKSA